MEYKIRLGVPEMDSFWQDITQKADTGVLDGNEEKLFKKKSGYEKVRLSELP